MAESRTHPVINYATAKRAAAVAGWRRWTGNITREQVISNLKTLAWTIPLTLLIWIYAEREQVGTQKDISVPFELVTDPARSVSLADTRPPQDKNLILELQGPQARLQEVKQKLSGGNLPQGLRIEIPSSLALNKEHSIDTLPLVQNDRIFTDAGVSVLSVQPSRIEVLVDQVVEREAKIVKPPSARNVDATFDPATVKVRGPLSLLTRAAQASAQHEESGRLSVYANIPEEVLRKPGKRELPDVTPLVRSPDLQDERIAIVEPEHVKATLNVRDVDEVWTIPSMTVFLTTPQGLLGRYEVADFTPALKNVTVHGPKEIIDAMKQPGYEPQPKARVEIKQADVGDKRSKTVQYDLPKGPNWEVQVADQDKDRTVEFRLVERSALPAPAP
jgi:hypothetical protein